MDRLNGMTHRAVRSGRTRVSRARGFTLAEVIVTMVIIATLAAVLVPAVFSRGKAARVDAIVAEFSNLEQAIMLYRNDVGRYPGRIDYLNKFPTTPASLPLVDACGTALSAQNQAKYRGPYISRPIALLNEVTLPWYVLATGDSVNATLTVIPSFQGQRVIQIEINGPELDIAKAVDASIDGVEAFDAGKLQYTDNGGAGANAGMEKSLTYTIPVRAGNC